MKDVPKRMKAARSILNGLYELSSIGIEYGDLHSSNIMMDKQKIIKLIDFGMAKVKRNIS